MARAAEGSIEPDERDGRHDDGGRDRRRAPAPERHAARSDEKRPVGGEEHEQAAAVGAEPASRDRDERQGRHGEAEAAEERDPEERGDEEHRLEQVRDAVEAARLGRPEGREGDRLGVEPEGQQVCGEHRRTGRAEREQRGREPDERDDPPAREPEVRGEPEQDHPRREPRHEHRGDVGDPPDEERERQPDAVVPLDPRLQALEHRHGVVHRDDLEPAVRDVGQ